LLASGLSDNIDGLDGKETISMTKNVNKQSYDAPLMTVIGTVQELTAGPVTPFAEDPSGQKGSKSANSGARVEEE
jgi:hypothetical protein